MVVDLEFALDPDLEVRHGRRPGGSSSTSPWRFVMLVDLEFVLDLDLEVRHRFFAMIRSPGRLSAEVNSSSPLPIVLRVNPGRVPPDHARPSSHFDSELVSIITPSRSAASLPQCWCQASKA